MASYIPNFHGPYLWKSGLHVAIFQALGLSRVLGLGDYLHVIGVIRHYGSLADGLVTFLPVGTVVVWHVNVYPGMLGHYYCILWRLGFYQWVPIQFKGVEHCIGTIMALLGPTWGIILAFGIALFTQFGLVGTISLELCYSGNIVEA